MKLEFILQIIRGMDGINSDRRDEQARRLLGGKSVPTFLFAVNSKMLNNPVVTFCSSVFHILRC